MNNLRNPNMNNKQPSYQINTTQSVTLLNSSDQLPKQEKPVSKANKEIKIGEYLGKGETAEVFSLQNDDKNVLKLYKKNVNPTKISEEYQKTKKIFKLGINTPEVQNMLTVNNRQGIIMEKAQGQTLEDHLRATPEKSINIAEALGKAQASIHNHSCDNLPSQKEFYKFYLERFYGSQKEKILEILDKLPENNRICHNDFHLGNVFITDDALNNGLFNEAKTIDWATVTKGNPIGDFAKTLVNLQCSASKLKMTPEMQETTKIVIEKFVHTYLDSIDYPVSREELDKWRIVTSSVMVTMLSYVKESKVDLAEKNRLDQSINNYKNLINKLLEKY